MYEAQRMSWPCMLSREYVDPSCLFLLYYEFFLGLIWPIVWSVFHTYAYKSLSCGGLREIVIEKFESPLAAGLLGRERKDKNLMLYHHANRGTGILFLAS